MSPRPTICRKRGCYIHGSPSGEGERCSDCPYEREAKMMHRLIIKGDADEAKQAALTRGITLVNAWSHLPNETHAYADCENSTLAQWFCEPATLGVPFPTGTLLHYTDGTSGDKR